MARPFKIELVNIQIDDNFLRFDINKFCGFDFIFKISKKNLLINELYHD